MSKMDKGLLGRIRSQKEDKKYKKVMYGYVVSWAAFVVISPFYTLYIIQYT